MFLNCLDFGVDLAEILWYTEENKGHFDRKRRECRISMHIWAKILPIGWMG